MKHHTFTAVTCARARRLNAQTNRNYGYTVIIQPPLQQINTGADVEGSGWVPKWGGPALQAHTHLGWYRFIEDAAATAARQNESASWACACKQCDPTNPIHQPRNLDLVA